MKSPLAWFGIGIMFFCCTSCYKKQDAIQTTLGSHVSSPPKIKERTKIGLVTRISLEQAFLKHQNQTALFYDARPAFVYVVQRIAGAKNLPLRQFDKYWEKEQPLVLAALRDKKTIIIYCTDQDCPDATKLAQLLAEEGLDCSVLQGGIHAWKEVLLPTE